ncbi:hypothetical protein [Phenylobacterium sp.]|uniref:hypothetical protein n=1 Tax=Phenylobacterium sp. TaxID=1871053 RepID=UPI0030F4086E
MSQVLGRLFPAQFDNVFRGRKIALWVFYLVTALVLWRSQHHILAPDGGARSIATIPLDTYASGASANIIAIFAQWGLSQLLLGALMLIAAVRYRSMVPLMWLVFIVELAGRSWVGHDKPLVTVATAPGAAANIPMLVLATLMLVLSLWPEKMSAA